MTENKVGRKFSISGIVQGVGFRPYVFNLATRNSLTGSVWNTSSGVEIELFGNLNNIESFSTALKNDPPMLARIDKFEYSSIPWQEKTIFSIITSQSEDGQFIPISPDVSICSDCQRELFDPNNFRYRYPFINCTNCGPRFSIIMDIPYDRPKTTMASFEFCPDCKNEYLDPGNRRFHAQPVACNKCGPKLTLLNQHQVLSTGEDALIGARERISAGQIIAVKGLGGFHLVCDAENESSVQMLRQRKKRSDRPFALMCFDLQTIKNYCLVNNFEAAELANPAHPIVLLEKKNDCRLPENLAPKQKHLGFMLPYTPLHFLLLEPRSKFPKVLVMTSGNLSDEPIAYEDQDAFERLSSVADCFLVHDRPIHMRVDDSVIRVFEDQPYPIRRSRGYAPDPIRLTKEIPQILACGAELKNTFALSRSNYAFISHHIGDLENYETLTSFESGISHFQKLFRISPQVIAADMHPDYLSTKYAVDRSIKESLPFVEVQHHHAHLASCLADNNWQDEYPVIGLIFDGTGYGLDGNIWGGEVLVGSFSSFERKYHLSEMPLPGGDIAIRNPSRIALAYLLASNIGWAEDLPPVQITPDFEKTVIHHQIQQKINTSITTSMGRLFDAVASLSGIRHSVSYEGQAAIELENLCDLTESSSYQFTITEDKLEFTNLLYQCIEDLRNNIGLPIISARFHNATSKMCLDVCKKIRQEKRISTVALSGGVWQNMTLLRKTKRLLQEDGFTVLIHHQVPTNDAGISLGQIMVASKQFIKQR